VTLRRTIARAGLWFLIPLLALIFSQTGVDVSGRAGATLAQAAQENQLVEAIKRVDSISYRLRETTFISGSNREKKKVTTEVFPLIDKKEQEFQLKIESVFEGVGYAKASLGSDEFDCDYTVTCTIYLNDKEIKKFARKRQYAYESKGSGRRFKRIWKKSPYENPVLNEEIVAYPVAIIVKDEYPETLPGSILFTTEPLPEALP